MQELQKEHKGINYTLVPFEVGADEQDLRNKVNGFITYGDPLKSDIVHRFKTFYPVSGDIASTVESYGRNRLILRAGFDEVINWKGGFYIIAETENGQQALSLLEHGLNQDGPDFPVTIISPDEISIHRTIPKTYQPLSEIPLDIEESISYTGKKCVGFAIERSDIGLMWREVYMGFIEELDAEGIEETPQDNTLMSRVTKLLSLIIHRQR